MYVSLQQVSVSVRNMIKPAMLNNVKMKMKRL